MADINPGRSIISRYASLVVTSFAMNMGEFHDDQLRAAAELGNEPLVKFLVDRGADKRDMNVMKTAVKHGHESIVRFLIDRSGRIQSNVCFPICDAVSNNHESLVRLFVENGALKSDYGMALHVATVCGNRPIMKYLIENGSIVSDETLDVARRKNLLDVWDL